MQWLRGILIVFVVFITNINLTSTTAQTAAGQFSPAACPFQIGQGMVEGQTVRCGYLSVPEDRGTPGSPTIRLAVAIFKSPSATPAPDPVIFLQGGPGGALLQDLGPAITARLAPVIVGSRDLILLDQRGTGYSQPALTCPEFAALKYRTLDQNISDAAGTAQELQAARQCRARLLGEHVDLSAYTTLADAADVQDLRRALGYAQVNLYGVSYGTRLALTIMRAFPTGIRSVVLDSVLPAQTDFFTSPPGALNRVLNVLFQGCAASATCNTAYPDLASTFYSLVRRLNAHPVTLVVRAADTGKSYKMLITGDVVVDITFNAFYQTPLIAMLPQMIAEAARGTYTQLAQVAGQVEFQFDSGISQGVYYSVECSEDAPSTTASQVTASVHQLPAVLRSYALSSSLPDLQVCALWHVKKAPASEREPVTSTIPTLVLSGEYDPITPPSLGALAARGLRHSFTFIVPGTGHGVFLSDRCPYRITQDFLDDPTARPVEAGCIAGMSEPAFTVPGTTP